MEMFGKEDVSIVHQELFSVMVLAFVLVELINSISEEEIFVFVMKDMKELEMLV